jgi:hypothetical protein
MFEKSMRLLIYNQTQTHIKNSSKNILLLEPKTKDYKTFHFHKVDEIRALGLGLLTQISYNAKIIFNTTKEKNEQNTTNVGATTVSK